MGRVAFVQKVEAKMNLGCRVLTSEAVWLGGFAEPVDLLRRSSVDRSQHTQRIAFQTKVVTEPLLFRWMTACTFAEKTNAEEI